MTGHLGAQLERTWSRWVPYDGERWRWRVRYKKFRGRGPGAFEAVSGADGIFQIEVTHSQQNILFYKGILFQAKKNDIRRDPRLREQIEKMEHLAPGSSAVFEYNRDRYAAASGHHLLAVGRGDALGRDRLQPLGSFLGDRFLPCEVGIRGMYYDGVRGMLLVPKGLGEIAAIRVELGHRIAVEFEAEPSV